LPEYLQLIWLLPPVHLFMAIAASIHALLHHRDSRGAFGWIAICIILPIGGPIIYLLFGVNRVNLRARQQYSVRLSKEVNDTQAEPVGTPFRPLSNVGENLTGDGLVSCDEVTVLENGDALYPAMLKAIDAATQTIFLCTYIFDNDATGKEFVLALTAAKNRGIDTKVIVDGMGEWLSVGRIGPSLTKAGISFVRFNPITLTPPALNINLRSHRKLLIVDSTIAFTGGANIGDRHLCSPQRTSHCAQDIHFRLKGRIVDELEWAFLRDWYYCIGTLNFTPYKNKNPTRPDAQAWSRLVLDGPNKEIDRLSDLIIGIIGAAHERVWIMTPYFLPSLDLIGALIAAHLRGVDVRILLPSKNNIKLAHWASRNVLRPILEKSIPVYYQPAPFIHSKLMIIDSQYSLIGSANLDPRSLKLNYELGVEMFSAELNGELRSYFAQKQNQSQRITKEDLELRTLFERLRDSVAWLFSPYL
jgi:cardiolipin synthase